MVDMVVLPTVDLTSFVEIHLRYSYLWRTKNNLKYLDKLVNHKDKNKF